MKINQLSPSSHEAAFTDGTRILYSYETPVAAFLPAQGYVKTAKFHSRTTGRHIAQWLKDGAGQFIHADDVSQEVLNQIAEAR